MLFVRLRLNTLSDHHSILMGVETIFSVFCTRNGVPAPNDIIDCLMISLSKHCLLSWFGMKFQDTVL